ncbi:MAG: hypothetical protein H6710_04910 [Myxococcales bacterium]|nr:hypothetical protein [Myxococcales bacterium]
MNTRILLLTLGIALAACGGAREGEGTPAASAPPAPAERAAEPGEAAPPSPPADASGGAPGEAGEAADASARLLRWLDPEAVGVTWVSARHDLDADALVAVFGVPPRAARMLRELEVVDEGLALVLGEEKAKAWLRPEAMAMLPAVAHGTYVVRLLEGAPPDELRAALEAAEMEASEVEGFTLWEPTGSFPWRIMIADASTIAMIPRQEIGSGIGPLTAARDLPPSELERELGRALSSEPDILLDLFAQGPAPPHGHHRRRRPLPPQRPPLAGRGARHQRPPPAPRRRRADGRRARGPTDAARERRDPGAGRAGRLHRRAAGGRRSPADRRRGSRAAAAAMSGRAQVLAPALALALACGVPAAGVDERASPA